jgi:hypothetical protein
MPNRVVYIDESGDTGRRSKYVVFASIETDTPRVLEKAIKKIWRAKPQFHSKGELHAYNAEDAIKTRVLKTLNELHVAIRFTVFDKSAVDQDISVLYYKELASFITQHRGAHIFIVDRKDTDKRREKILSQYDLGSAFKNVTFAESHKVKELQAVDL